MRRGWAFIVPQEREGRLPQGERKWFNDPGRSFGGGRLECPKKGGLVRLCRRKSSHFRTAALWEKPNRQAAGICFERRRQQTLRILNDKEGGKRSKEDRSTKAEQEKNG